MSEVLFDKPTQIGMLLLASTFFGCSDPTTTPPPPEPSAAWQIALDAGDLDRAVLSVWGSGPNDVFAVGGALGNGQETLALHFDGTSFKELHPGGTETFWWVSGSGADDVWMVGEKGRIAHWNGSTFESHVSGVTATLWGVFATSKTDAWAVGGTPEGGTALPNDIVLHWDGQAWAPITLPGPALGRSLYKIWGTSADNLYVVGEAGTVWHKKGTTWLLESETPLATGTLFTVAGASESEIYAVGGVDVLRSDGSSWQKVDVLLGNSVNGVAANGPGDVAIVGFGGLKQRLVSGAWVDDFEAAPHGDLHAVWADGLGTFWAVGGSFVSKSEPGASRQGIVARFSKSKAPTEITP